MVRAAKIRHASLCVIIAGKSSHHLCIFCSLIEVAKELSVSQVLYICVGFGLLAHLTRDLSQAEKKIVVILSVGRLVRSVIFFSAWDKSRVEWPMAILPLTPIYSRSLERKKFKHFVFYKYFSLVLGLLKSRIAEKVNQGLLRKPDFKLFHYKTRVQPVSKITTIATRNRCYM